jgi:hypothetical protein
MVVTGLDVNGVLHKHSPLEAQLQATLNIVPAYAWYGFQRGTNPNRNASHYHRFDSYSSLTVRPR